MQEAGVKVLRTWVGNSAAICLLVFMSCFQGFNAINATELPGALESGLTYYQACIIPTADMSDSALTLITGVE